MRVKPKLAYKLLGTDIQLNPKKWYTAYLATNQPSRKDGKKQYFVGEILLTEDEITGGK